MASRRGSRNQDKLSSYSSLYISPESDHEDIPLQFISKHRTSDPPSLLDPTEEIADLFPSSYHVNVSNPYFIFHVYVIFRSIINPVQSRA